MMVSRQNRKRGLSASVLGLRESFDFSVHVAEEGPGEPGY